MDSFTKVQYYVFHNRVDEFHWNIADSFEYKRKLASVNQNTEDRQHRRALSASCKLTNFDAAVQLQSAE